MSNCPDKKGWNRYCQKIGGSLEFARHLSKLEGADAKAIFMNWWDWAEGLSDEWSRRAVLHVFEYHSSFWRGEDSPEDFDMILDAIFVDAKGKQLFLARLDEVASEIEEMLSPNKKAKEGGAK